MQPTIIRQNPEPEVFVFGDDGVFPNNSTLPVIIYRGVLLLGRGSGAHDVEEIFALNDWRGAWRNGIYPYHHYHSTAHEVLGAYAGAAKVQLGGDHGLVLPFAQGDVFILPAGTAHKLHSSSSEFAVVGAYPQGQLADMNYGLPGEKDGAWGNVSRVRIPSLDPVFGSRGALVELWRAENRAFG